MTYGAFPYGGVAYAGSQAGGNPQTDTTPITAIEIAFTTNALATPVWVDITPDVRFYDVSRGRSRELERFQPGRATIVLSNLSRQYDSINAAGPWFGNIKPNRRIRIRETFNGVTYPVFDGLIDKWQLDYPGVGKDATATVTATDWFKLFGRTDLGRSVYENEVRASAPLVWWRLDDDKDVAESAKNAANSGSGGASHEGVIKGGVQFKQEGIVVRDPGSSMTSIQDEDTSGTHIMGASIPNATYSLLSQSAFSVEMWLRTTSAKPVTTTNNAWSVSRAADASSHAAMGFVNDPPPSSPARPNLLQFVVANAAFSDVRGVQTPDDSIIAGKVYHVVCTKAADNTMTIYLNGTPYTTTAVGASANTWPASVPTNGDFAITHTKRASGASATDNWTGEVSQVSIYNRVLTAAEISAHYTAGTIPWNAVFASGRIRQVLSLMAFPGGPLYLPGEFVELDDGATLFQSAELAMTALEMLQKAAESEFGLFFITRAGVVRFIDRAHQFARAALPIIFGDSGSEIGYRALVPDDGDEVIRNRATISRLNGVAQLSSDATSLSEHGPFDYTLDGLLHSSDAHSASYAAFIVAEYKQPRRRIRTMTVGPAIAGLESTVYPAMLGLELGDAITVRSRPIGGGALFEQVCVVEGIEISNNPGEGPTAVFQLSPEITGSF